MKNLKPNHLIHESSPYLLQHAYNPVEWFSWGDDAFEKARKEDKPILVSIGYAACHWCHVMEHESFEDEATAKFMNTYFVNIKVDREERPDVDHIYMNACQLLTGAGGWPLNVFLTPELLPFSGGTYFPPKPGYGKPSWMEVLMYMKNIFTNERDKVEEQANMLKEHLVKMDDAFIAQINIPENEQIITTQKIASAVKNIQQQFDAVDGGFGSAPKFPGTMSLLFLLRNNYYTPDDAILNHVNLSLRKMMLGGIYDHVGGGFSRYTVDKKWMIPHFEKMLYDNALLVSLFSEAYRITGNIDYKETVDKTLQFVERELMHPDFGFYASYDADSEGVEGKFYTYNFSELENLFPDEIDFIKDVYAVTETGNWEHTNILFRKETDSELAQKYNTTETAIKSRLSAINQTLYNYRKNRIMPGLDDKIILSWNALMCSAFVQAFKATGNNHYREIAIKNIDFMLIAFADSTNVNALLHTYKNSVAKYPAFIEDYAALIQALIDVYEISGNDEYLIAAQNYTEHVIQYFVGADSLFYFTSKGQADVPYRSRDFYDNATPSGNAIMMQNLIRLSHLNGNANYRAHAEKMLVCLGDNMIKHANSFGCWLSGALTFVYPYAEIGVTGKNAFVLRDEILAFYYPHTIIQADNEGSLTYPLVAERFDTERNSIYLCRNNTCNLPVSTVQDFIEALNKF